MPNQLPLIIERKGSVLIISLNNPEKRNALNSEMMGAAASAIANVGNYKELRSVVIQGTGSSFCSGAEVTNSAVIYFRNKKYSLESEKIKPNFYLLIPKYLKLLDKNIKASSGFDAISQSIESIFSLKSSSKSLSYAKQSLKISINYITC